MRILLPIILLLAGCSSTPHNPKLSDAAVKLVGAGCVVLEEATDSSTVDEVCATAEELAPLVKIILGRRARANDAGVEAASD